jgi:hypothetical protein
MAKPKTVRVGNVTVRQVSPNERQVLAKKIKQRHDLLRNRYREIHGKIVDWVSHSFRDGSLCVSIRFMDKTDFSLRFSLKILTENVYLSDMSTGNFEMIRRYPKRANE